MKKIVFFILLIPTLAKTQCIGGSCQRENSLFSPVFIVDNSFKYFQPSGFSGIGLYGGIWAGSLGFVVGGVDSKEADKKNARRDLTFGIMTRIHLFDENVQVIPFLNVGTNNYQDAGIRVGYKIGSGSYLSAMSSITMHYGMSVIVTISKN